MAENVNGINTNPSLAVTQYTGNPKNTQPEAEETKPEAPAAAPREQVSPDDVFSYMAMNAPIKNVGPTYDIGKYVTPEQAARIAAMMTDFEGAVATGLVALEQEFGEGLSEATKYELAAAMVE